MSGLPLPGKIAGLLLALAISFFPTSGAATDSDGQDDGTRKTALMDRLGVDESGSRLRGVSLAESVTQVTGVAISPLLGVSILGGWKYWTTPAEARGDLPWVCHPVFWGIGFAVLLICFFKDSLGAVAPTFLKKPLDLIELFEDKLSALIASTAFVPFLIEQAVSQDFVPAEEASAVAGGPLFAYASPPAFLAAIDPTWVLLPIAIVGFFIVWITSHAINVIILLSPFGILDAALKLFRLAILSSMGILYLISPVLAAIFSGVIIAICAFLAPRAFRLSVYGTVVGFDYLRSLVRKVRPKQDKVSCFLARQGNQALKTRSFGRVVLDPDNRVVFHSRWLFFGPNRSLKLPESGSLILTKGFLFPTIQTIDADTGKTLTIIHLLPRHRHFSDEVAEMLRLETRDTPATRGYRAAREWLREIIRPAKEKPIENSA